MTARSEALDGGEADLTSKATSELRSQSDQARTARTEAAGFQQPGHRVSSPGVSALQRLHAEQLLLERLAEAGLPRLDAGTQDAERLLPEAAAGISLQQHLRSARPALPALLDILVTLLRTITDLHRLGRVHHNINPETILLVGSPPRPMLTGINLAGDASDPRSGDPVRIADSVSAYTAPEQTGRTGRAADQRADLYAIGVMLYEWAAGRLPFEHGDPLQLVHDILALVPTPPCEIEPGTPPALSDIVMRLLEKEPERRYQSAEGLRHDLARLRERIAGGQNGSF